ncbi:unnamed protein product [Staurois parvus]|uniref:Uncharacterized protein n=1 Tax=Staurois parvus TaxID=386267 RepID=A0ABN9BSW7_9NEOB|nr:unnamed protein product [Staurois parvus]
MLFDPDLYDPPSSSAPLLSPDNTFCVETLCTCSVWCVLLERFFSWESACDQHRANQHCPDRGNGFYILLEQK